MKWVSTDVEVYILNAETEERMVMAGGKPFIFLTSLSLLIDFLKLTVSSSSESPQVYSSSFRMVIG